MSAASVWGIAIKRAWGKLTAPDDLASVMAAAGFSPRSITLEHATLAEATAPGGATLTWVKMICAPSGIHVG